MDESFKLTLVERSFSATSIGATLVERFFFIVILFASTIFSAATFSPSEITSLLICRGAMRKSSSTADIVLTSCTTFPTKNVSQTTTPKVTDVVGNDTTVPFEHRPVLGIFSLAYCMDMTIKPGWEQETD